MREREGGTKKEWCFGEECRFGSKCHEGAKCRKRGVNRSDLPRALCVRVWGTARTGIRMEIWLKGELARNTPDPGDLPKFRQRGGTRDGAREG